MKTNKFAKIVLLAAAMALPAGLASAKTVKLPPGACAFGRTGVANNTFCSHDCNPQTSWCSQQLCTNGVLVQVVPCYGTFCTAKCGG